MTPLKTFEDFVEHANKNGYKNGEEWAKKNFEQKKLDDQIFFTGNRDQLIALFVKQRNPDPAKKADATLAKRSELQSSGKADTQRNVFASGTFEELVEHATKQGKNDPVVYARAVLRNRLKNVLDNGSRDEVIEAAKMLRVDSPEGYADGVMRKRGSIPSGAGTTITAVGASDTLTVPAPKVRDFDGLVKFGESKGVDDAFKFAQNIILKDNRAILDTGTVEQIRPILIQARIANPDGFLKAVLERRVDKVVATVE